MKNYTLSFLILFVFFLLGCDNYLPKKKRPVNSSFMLSMMNSQTAFVDRYLNSLADKIYNQEFYTKLPDASKTKLLVALNTLVTDTTAGSKKTSEISLDCAKGGSATLYSQFDITNTVSNNKFDRTSSIKNTVTTIAFSGCGVEDDLIFQTGALTFTQTVESSLIVSKTGTIASFSETNGTTKISGDLLIGMKLNDILTPTTTKVTLEETSKSKKRSFTVNGSNEVESPTLDSIESNTTGEISFSSVITNMTKKVQMELKK
jgi:hypothetical protein